MAQSDIEKGIQELEQSMKTFESRLSVIEVNDDLVSESLKRVADNQREVNESLKLVVYSHSSLKESIDEMVKKQRNK